MTRTKTVSSKSKVCLFKNNIFLSLNSTASYTGTFCSSQDVSTVETVSNHGRRDALNRIEEAANKKGVVGGKVFGTERKYTHILQFMNIHRANRKSLFLKLFNVLVRLHFLIQHLAYKIHSP